MYEHKVPIYLGEPDKFLLNCTARQIMVLGIGIACGYLALTAFNLETIEGWLAGIPLALICVGIAAIIAFLKIRHRYLEQWGIVWYIYASFPKVFLWRPLEAPNDDNEVQYEPLAEEDEELW